MSQISKLTNKSSADNDSMQTVIARLPNNPKILDLPFFSNQTYFTNTSFYQTQLF